MNIVYVKTRKDGKSVKDPMLAMIRELLPDDNVRCVDVSPVIGCFQEGLKMEFLLHHDSNPDLLIGCGDAATPILQHGHRYCMLINPDMDEELGQKVSRSSRVKILKIDEICMETLSEFLVPAIDSIREAVRPYAEQIESLIEMALSPTDMTPEGYDMDNDILDNLKRHRDTVEIAGKCPDCGHQMIRFYVSSPGWTWQKLCGRAGRLTYCPHCKTQHGFFLQFMN